MKILIEKLVFGGYGLGRTKTGKPVFVRKSVPGDEIEVDAIEEKKNFIKAVIKKIIKPAKERITPPCPYFEKCGGCDHQNISYQNQLKYKDEFFQEVLDRAKVKVKPEKIILGSNHPFYYRNSIRFFLIQDKNKNIQLARHNFIAPEKYLAVDNCMLQSETSGKIVQQVKEFINKNILYKSTFWQLKIREGRRTGDFMVEIITSGEELPKQKGIVKSLREIKGIRSIYHTIAVGKSLKNLKRRLIFGSPIIYEKIGGFTFQISPESFFQTNSEEVKTLYDKIKEFAEIKMGDEIVDLYCGTGTIGIYLSTLARSVTGIEIVSEAVRDAIDNARINKISNCKFICFDVHDFLNSSLRKLDNAIVIIDPPRAGLGKNLVNLLSKAKFKHLVYISCNPSTFARDLKYFEERGIKTRKIQPIDMFPQTNHIECVGLLSKNI